jgi:hypothetical protein
MLFGSSKPAEIQADIEEKNLIFKTYIRPVALYIIVRFGKLSPKESDELPLG